MERRDEVPQRAARAGGRDGATRAAGEVVDPKSYYFRMVTVSEAGSKKYEWMNKIVAVGSRRGEPTGPIYTVEEVP